MTERRALSVAIFVRRTAGPDAGRVLLIKHRRLATWLPVGGEVEAGERRATDRVDGAELDEPGDPHTPYRPLRLHADLRRDSAERAADALLPLVHGAASRAGR